MVVLSGLIFLSRCSFYPININVVIIPSENQQNQTMDITVNVVTAYGGRCQRLCEDR